MKNESTASKLLLSVLNAILQHEGVRTSGSVGTVLEQKVEFLRKFSTNDSPLAATHHPSKQQFGYIRKLASVFLSNKPPP